MLIKSFFTGKMDKKIKKWMSRYGISLLRISMGIVFFWFGFLKFFPGISPAEGIAVKTISIITFDLFSPRTILIILAIWESVIGIGLIFGVYLREVLLLLFLQMTGTFAPLFFFPAELFTEIPYAPTLEGQYIIKNIVIISGAIVIGAKVRGGRLSKDANS